MRSTLPLLLLPLLLLLLSSFSLFLLTEAAPGNLLLAINPNRGATAGTAVTTGSGSVLKAIPLFNVTDCLRGACFPESGDLLVGRSDRFTVTYLCSPETNADTTTTTTTAAAAAATTATACPSSGEPFYSSVDRARTSTQSPRINESSSEEATGNVHRDEKTDSEKENIWLSPSGVEGLSLKLDLETVFQLFNIKIVLAATQAEPVDVSIERSSDSGVTWSVYQYFARNCSEFVSNNTNTWQTRSLIEASCEQFTSINYKYDFNVTSTDAMYDGMLALSSAHLEYSKVTNVRINFSRSIDTSNNSRHSNTSDGHIFAVESIIINGTCFCNGHSSKCIPAQVDQTLVPGMIYGRCQCSHFTTGANCQECLALYNDRQWRSAVAAEKNECKLCDCNHRAAHCHYDPLLFEAHASGGVCEDCDEGTFGVHCEKCSPFYFRNILTQSCDPCRCDMVGSSSNECNAQNGSCPCRDGWEGRTCNKVKSPQITTTSLPVTVVTTAATTAAAATTTTTTQVPPLITGTVSTSTVLSTSADDHLLSTLDGQDENSVPTVMSSSSLDDTTEVQSISPPLSTWAPSHAVFVRGTTMETTNIEPWTAEGFILGPNSSHIGFNITLGNQAIAQLVKMFFPSVKREPPSPSSPAVA